MWVSVFPVCQFVPERPQTLRVYKVPMEAVWVGRNLRLWGEGRYVRRPKSDSGFVVRWFALFSDPPPHLIMFSLWSRPSELVMGSIWYPHRSAGVLSPKWTMPWMIACIFYKGHYHYVIRNRPDAHWLVPVVSVVPDSNVFSWRGCLYVNVIVRAFYLGPGVLEVLAWHVWPLCSQHTGLMQLLP